MNPGVMARQLAKITGMLVLLLVAGSAAQASDQGQAAAQQVTETTYRYFLGDTQGNYGILYTHTGHNRGVNGPHHDLCRDNIYNHMLSYGLTVTLEPVVYLGVTYYNVVGTKLGMVDPNREYVIGAHYDSVSNPGADDNASGVALVLECARIITQYPSDYTIRFIAFTREEQGLYGSTAYVSQHAGDNIVAMISADMQAYDTGTNSALVYGRNAPSPAQKLKNDLRRAISLYSTYNGITLTSTDGGWNGQSDHAPFDAAGYPACLLIEGQVWSNPNYHTQADCVDTPGYINYAHAVRMTRSAIGYLVDHARVHVYTDTLEFSYPNGHPDFIDPAGLSRMRVVVTGLANTVPAPGTGMLHYNDGSGWTAVPMDMVEPNVYDAVFPTGACRTELLYYVTAQDTTGRVYADPWDAPDYNTYSTLFGYGDMVIFEETLDANPGWSVQGQWAWGQPTGGGSHNHDPTSGYTGLYVYGYNLNGDYPNNMTSTLYLTTAPINCSGITGVRLTFYRWLGVESNNNYDKATIDVSGNNGSTWTTIWRAADTGRAISDAYWVYQHFDISAIADNRPQVRIRWGMGPTDGSVTYPGWNIDDVRLVAVRCERPYPVGDMNCDGLINAFDIDAFVLALTSPAGYAESYPDCFISGADINGDGTVDAFDIDPFVDLLTVQ